MLKSLINIQLYFKVLKNLSIIILSILLPLPFIESGQKIKAQERQLPLATVRDHGATSSDNFIPVC
ncbi:hypothetical protein [Candidatus Tisiphia endosymbiont of Empis tessellata]|uniref:hypothetical protein n=1 Tax=Candidatus Tisiphia endosymbiont of Empis tessellata TaxID=3066259 RepID=UPI00313E71C7